MIAKTKVIEKMRDFKSEYKPFLTQLEIELDSDKPDLNKLEKLADEITFPLLDMLDTLNHYQSLQRKLDK